MGKYQKDYKFFNNLFLIKPIYTLSKLHQNGTY